MSYSEYQPQSARPQSRINPITVSWFHFFACLLC